jgi:uncharacterized protein (DUF2062 family)
MTRFPRFRKFLDRLLHTHDTPQRTALAFGIGVFFGFSPFLGLHTVLGLICAFAFGLNRVAVLIGIYSNLPWILPAYYTLMTVAGAALLGTTIPPGLVSEMTRAFGEASWRELRTLASGLAPLLWAFTLGSTLGAIILGLAAYRLSLATIVAHRRHAALQHPNEPIDS